ncbi:MAG: hypothetical protein H0U71_02555 [Gammaproteobacteria bacterium]|nr:hypothetical protein [Gammaproteobacteria bacterium]
MPAFQFFKSLTEQQIAKVSGETRANMCFVMLNALLKDESASPEAIIRCCSEGFALTQPSLNLPPKALHNLYSEIIDGYKKGAASPRFIEFLRQQHKMIEKIFTTKDIEAITNLIRSGNPFVIDYCANEMVNLDQSEKAKFNAPKNYLALRLCDIDSMSIETMRDFLEVLEAKKSKDIYESFACYIAKIYLIKLDATLDPIQKKEIFLQVFESGDKSNYLITSYMANNYLAGYTMDQDDLELIERNFVKASEYITLSILNGGIFNHSSPIHSLMEQLGSLDVEQELIETDTRLSEINTAIVREDVTEELRHNLNKTKAEGMVRMVLINETKILQTILHGVDPYVIANNPNTETTFAP